ncbi:unnamed protein product [Blepharisma stoltei]|uniref:Uncharacterized protein n=1 Tax=Blepharisma stoltei TaxID=1481888 RepID=A0AAU9JWP7_9CILI|nr:unnamed protein product [Blepharisma stoltei]
MNSCARRAILVNVQNLALVIFRIGFYLKEKVDSELERKAQHLLQELPWPLGQFPNVKLRVEPQAFYFLFDGGYFTRCLFHNEYSFLAYFLSKKNRSKK